MSQKIEYPLSESQKQQIRDRLEEVFNQKDGIQVIILWDKDRLTDCYQNICMDHLIEGIKSSAEHYRDISEGKLIH